MPKILLKKRVAPCGFYIPYSIIYLYIQSMGESRIRSINHPKSFFTHIHHRWTSVYMGYYIHGTYGHRHNNYSIINLICKYRVVITILFLTVYNLGFTIIGYAGVFPTDVSLTYTFIITVC